LGEQRTIDRGVKMRRYVGKFGRREQRGAAVVELALVLPLLVMLIFGLITTGLAYTDHLAISNAAREGARLGSSADYTTPNASTWATSVRDRVKQVYFNGSSSLTDNQICVNLKSAASTVLASWSGSACASDEPGDPPGAFDGNTCIVKVWVAKPQEIQLMIVPVKRFTISAQSVSLYGRKADPCKLP
jgi:Flp pilus assembly protein TadG